MVNKTKLSLKTARNRYVFTAVFAAMIAVSGFIIIPLPGSPVPLVFKNLFVVLAGTILGSYYGAVSLSIFIIAGIIGVPVFVVPGLAAFSTPLGGYIIGYFFASLIAGLICGLPKTSEKKIKAFFLFRLIIASLAGFLIIISCGVFFLMRLNSMSFIAAFSAGALPYLLGDFIKLAISIPLALKLRPIVARYINE